MRSTTPDISPRRGANLIAALLLLAVAGCTSPAEPAPTPAPTPSATAAPSPTEPPSPTATPTTPDEAAEVETLWATAQTVRITGSFDGGSTDAAAFADVADDDTAEILSAFTIADTPQLDITLDGYELAPVVEVGVGTATIVDCVLTAIRPTGSDTGEEPPTVTTIRWEGEATRGPDGWRLTDITRGAADCIPRTVADQAIAAYQAWLDGTAAWWNPPDPTHPLLTQLMASPALDDMTALLGNHAELGIVVRDTHDPAGAAVTDLTLDLVTVTDCYLAADGDTAAYDPSSGERRTDLTPEPSGGQRDLIALDVARIGPSAGKVIGWRSFVDVDCEPGGTPYVVAP